MTISPPMMPVIAAITTATNVVCTATPPRSSPATIDIALKRSSATPARSRMLAMNTNSGTATSG